MTLGKNLRRCRLLLLLERAKEGVALWFLGKLEMG